MNVAYAYLEQCGIAFNRDTARKFLASHPYYPSLLSISDLFDEFRTENMAIQLAPEDLGKVPIPFLAAVNSAAEEDFVMVTAYNDQQATYINNSDRATTLGAAQFRAIFAGTVLLAEKNEASGEPQFHANRKSIRRRKATQAASLCLIIIAALSGFALHNLTGNFSFALLLLFFAKAAGLFFSTLLLIQHFNAEHSLVKKLCRSQAGNGCSHILSSPAASILKGAVSWSEIGFLYFGITLWCMIGQKVDAAAIRPLLYLNILALPYSIYSLWYQNRAKSWCRLCLSVQAVLWVEFTAGLFLSPQPFLAFSGFGYLLVPALLIPGLWFQLRPLFEKSAGVNELSRAVNSFKKNEQIFTTLLLQQRKVVVPANVPVILGNPDAAFDITLVSNPFCMPCAKVHQQLKKLLDTCPDKLRVSLIFLSGGDSNDERYQLHRYFMSVYHTSGSEAARAAIDSWYENPGNRAEDWLRGREAAPATPSADAQLNAQLHWSFEHNISQTPATFINGYQSLPQYQLPDLLPFILNK